jgi:hypothetical protein
MKKVFGLIALVSFALFSYNNIKKTDGLVDAHGIPDYTEVGSGNNTESTVDTEEVQNDEPVQHSQEAIDYFNTICRGSEYGSGNQISKWESDVNIYVMGEKPSYLMSKFKIRRKLCYSFWFSTRLC